MTRLLLAADRLDAIREGALERLTTSDDRIGLGPYVAGKFAGVLYDLDYWLSLPWRCRVPGHHKPERRESYNLDAGAVEEAWLECGRCGHWLGYLPEGVRSPR